MPMSSTATASNTTAPTQILQVGSHSYAYRRFGNGPGLPLLSLQHFTGTLDNWDPAVSDPLASGREVILFDNAGIGRSSGEVPETVAGMAAHVMAFLDGLHLEKPSLAKHLQDPLNTGYAVLQKIFFAPTSTSQASGEAFIARLMQRKDDRDPPSGPNVAKAQTTAFREWEHFSGERFADLKGLRHPTLVVQGFHDEMIPVRNSYWLAENL